MTIESAKSLALVTVGVIAVLALSEAERLSERLDVLEAREPVTKEYVDETDLFLLRSHYQAARMIDAIVERIADGELRYD